MVEDGIWRKMIIVPVRRVWLALSARLKPHRKHGAGLLKLEDDVQTCEYQDIQIMWEMLQRTEESDEPIENHHKRKQQQHFWRIFEWSSKNGVASLESGNHT